MHDAPLLPAPRALTRGDGGPFTLTDATAVDAGPGTERVAALLRTLLGPPTGLPFPPARPGDAGPRIRMALDDSLAARLGPESYRLDVRADGIGLTGGTAAGVHHGVQTLRQLLGPDAYRRAPVRGGPWTVAPVHIEDAPRFRWRGYLLDVARHFQPKDDVLRCLDLLALHKLNVLHLHLTDDQGWRLQIRSKPALTDTGAWRRRTRLGRASRIAVDQPAAPPQLPRSPSGAGGAPTARGRYPHDAMGPPQARRAEGTHGKAEDRSSYLSYSRDATTQPGGVAGVAGPRGSEKHAPGHRASPLWDERPHGGHYTQDDIREIVAYAAERHITVVPEIDLPGHSRAAVAAYPELGNADAVDTSTLGVWTDWGVDPHVLAPTDHTLRFYEDVLEEVLELFPSPYVHLGGDECPVEQWRASPAAQARIREEGLRDASALHAWFLGHFARYLAARGRRALGWDEILDGGPDGLPPDVTVASWRGYAGGIAAARAGHDVVMCPEQQVYLDHRQDPGEDEPVPLGYVRTLEDVYRFEPVPPELAGTPQEAHVLGTQANMWTEVTENRQRVDYQTFPRLAALAEVAWSPLPAPAERDAAGFRARLERAHLPRLDVLGVDYRPLNGPRPWQRRPGLLGRPIEGPPPIV